jgi:hypothetical protein
VPIYMPTLACFLMFLLQYFEQILRERVLTYIFTLKTFLEKLVIVCVACLYFRLFKCLHYDSKETGTL